MADSSLSLWCWAPAGRRDGGTATANPFPLLNKSVNNQFGFGRAIAGASGPGLPNLRAGFADAPATVQGLLAFNPASYLQRFVGRQIGYAQTVAIFLQSTVVQAGFGSLVVAKPRRR